MEHAVKMILALSLSGTATGLLLLLLRRVLGRRLPSGVYYYAWLLVLLRFALPVPGLLAAPAAGPGGSVPAGVWETGAPARHTGDFRSYGAVPAGGSATGGSAEVSVPDAAPTAELPSPPEPEASGAGNPLRSWTFWGAAWAAGVLAGAFRYLFGYFRFRRALYRTLRPADAAASGLLLALHSGPFPALYRSAVEGIGTPLLLGLLRPVIVLPDEDCAPELLEGILRHELTHYRRGDLAYKWFAAAVLCLHWFNPLAYLFRRELDRACELSCDACLLRDMDRDEKQRYGELLLRLAADRPLPRGVVATSFATGKRNLKERLIQIMTFQKKGKAALIPALAGILLLAGCAVAMGPAPAPEAKTEALARAASGAAWKETARTWNPPDAAVAVPIPTAAPVMQTESAGGRESVYAGTVDEFLAALSSDAAVIFLSPGEYNLTEASGYGKPTHSYQNYYWEDTLNGGYELKLCEVRDLTIMGLGGADQVSIVTEPRYADVLSFRGAENVTLAHLTLGHTPEPGYCSGGVIDLGDSDNILIDACVLYGCGTVGVAADNCRGVAIDNTVVKECSSGAVWAEGCYDVRFTNGQVYDCGWKFEPAADALFRAVTTTGFAVHNSEIYGNRARLLLSGEYSVGVQLRGCRVNGNRFGGMFRIQGNSALVDGCGFGGNRLEQGWYAPYDGETPGHAVDAAGTELSGAELEAMRRSVYPDAYDGPDAPAPVLPEGRVNDEGLTEYHVTTVDEFLAAIGSNTVIRLDAETFDLATATDYGGYGGNHYYWQNNYDGPGLVIAGVERLRICGMGKDRTAVEALPRYADVIAFDDCHEVAVENLTAGHTLGAGSCAGDVLGFRNCADSTVSGCGLFGCGVNGIAADRCRNLSVKDTEIYECSGYAAVIYDCQNVDFEHCEIHDCGSDSILSAGAGAGSVTWDGKTRQYAPQLFTGSAE